jgi:hypothetical protein
MAAMFVLLTTVRKMYKTDGIFLHVVKTTLHENRFISTKVI